QAEAGDHAVERALEFYLQHRALTFPVCQGGVLRHHSVHARLPALEPVAGRGDVSAARGEPDGWAWSREQASKLSAPLGEGLPPQIAPVDRERVERDERCRGERTQTVDTRGDGMETRHQRPEVVPVPR